MPRVLQKASRSLKVLCLHSVAENLDSLWCKHFLDFYFGNGHFIYVIGPFDQLPPSLIHDIWVFMKKRKLVRKHHAYLLLSPFAKSVDLSYLENDLGLMLLLTRQRCFQLLHINLSHTKLPRDQLSNCLPSLTNLSSASFAHSSVTNSQISILGSYCPTLTSVDLSYCTQITDQGLLTLFKPVDFHGNTDGRFGMCKNLSKVLVSGSQNITSDSITEMILDLKKLAVLDYQDSVGVIEKLVIEGRISRKLLLKSLYCLECTSQDTLPISVSTCPEVEHVFLVTNERLTTSILSLLDLRQIREIHIRNELGLFSLPVQEYLGPVLQIHGNTIVSINLAEVEQIDVKQICIDCPCLVHLVLLWNKSYITDSSSKQKEIDDLAFPNLLNVDMAFIDLDEENIFREIFQADLLRVLLSPKLKNIKICQSQNLTDDVMRLILMNSGLKNVESFQLIRCHEISYDGLRLFLEDYNRLESVSFNQCEEITKSDYQTFQKKVKKWKWNIKVEWS